jgi:hypothetical protein
MIFFVSRLSLRYRCSRWRSADWKIAVIDKVTDVNRSRIPMYARQSLLPALENLPRYLTVVSLPYIFLSLVYFLGDVTIISDYEDKRNTPDTQTERCVSLQKEQKSLLICIHAIGYV